MSDQGKTHEKAIQDLNREVDRIITQTGTEPRAVIPILHAIQNKYNYLPASALRRICDSTEITPAQIYGVSTFYDQFRHTPVGEHIIQICSGTACHVKGADLVFDAFTRELSIPVNDDTDEKGQFTIQKVACLGCCTLAPVVQIDGITYGHLSPGSVDHVMNDFLINAHNVKKDKIPQNIYKDSVGEVRIGLGSCCVCKPIKELPSL